MKIYKNEENEFVDYENDLVYIMESEVCERSLYSPNPYEDIEIEEYSVYTDVKECLDYNTGEVVKLTEEQKKEIVKLANSYGSKN